MKNIVSLQNKIISRLVLSCGTRKTAYLMKSICKMMINYSGNKQKTFSLSSFLSVNANKITMKDIYKMGTWAELCKEDDISYYYSSSKHDDRLKFAVYKKWLSTFLPSLCIHFVKNIFIKSDILRFYCYLCHVR